MSFSDVLSSLSADGTAHRVIVGDDWTQGRAAFGGLIAAVGNEVMRALVDRGQVVATQIGVYGGDRPSAVAVKPAAAVVRGIRLALTRCGCAARARGTACLQASRRTPCTTHPYS